MRIKEMFTYQAKDLLRGVVIFLIMIMGIMIILTMAFGSMSSENAYDSNTFVGFSFAAAIMMFVTGIVGAREYLRLGIQNGIGRKTVFISELLAGLLTCFALAVGSQIFQATGSFIATRYEHIYVSDLYNVIFENGETTMSAGIFAKALMTNTFTYCFAFIVGMFCSLLMYRLSKKGRFAAIAAFVLLFTVGIPFAAIKMPMVSVKIFGFMFGSPINLTISMIVLSAIVEAFNYGLSRKVQIKGI